MIYYESSASDDGSSYDELDGAEPPVEKTTRSARKTGHWPM